MMGWGSSNPPCVGVGNWSVGVREKSEGWELNTEGEKESLHCYENL